MKKIFIYIGLAALFVVLVGFLTNRGGISLSEINQQTQAPTPERVDVVFEKQEITVNASLSDTTDERQKGLSGKEGLSENEGMLFVFDSKDVESSFWMKDMKFSIDIIWINDGKVVGIEKDVSPEPDKAVDDLTLYSPPEPIDYVLEVNAGFSEKNSIEVGDSIIIPEEAF